MSISIDYYVKNPIPPTFWGLMKGTYKGTLTKTRVVSDDELYEIGVLLACGIDYPCRFKKEPFLNCALVINSATEAFNKNPMIYHLYRKFEAILKYHKQIESK